MRKTTAVHWIFLTLLAVAPGYYWQHRQFKAASTLAEYQRKAIQGLVEKNQQLWNTVQQFEGAKDGRPEPPTATRPPDFTTTVLKSTQISI